jgi:hypothetical protein
MDAAFRRGFDDEAFDFTGRRDTFGPSPSPEAVSRIIKRAVKCETRGVNEAAWFSLVHSELLALALENDTWEDEVDFVPWYAPIVFCSAPSLCLFSNLHRSSSHTTLWRKNTSLPLVIAFRLGSSITDKLRYLPVRYLIALRPRFTRRT